MDFKSILVVISLISYQVSAITLYCSKSDDGSKLTMTFRTVVDATSQQLEAIDATTAATSSCVSFQRDVDGSSTNELNITIDLSTDSQISPTVAASDCYVDVTVGTPTVYKINVVSQKTPGISVQDDSIYEGSCNSDVASFVEDIGSSGVTVLNTITPSVIAAVTDTIAAKLVDNAGADIAAPLNIGDEVRLRVTYTPPAGLIDGEFPKLLHLYDVLISGYSDFRTSFKLITSNGCLNTTTSTTLNMIEGPKYSAADSTPATPEFVSQSGLFKMPLLDGPAPKTVYVKFSYTKQCLTLTDPQCADQEQYCIDNALDRNQNRKRRSAMELDHEVLAKRQYSPFLAGVDLARVKRNTPELGTNGTLQFAVPIAVYGDAVQAGRRGNDGTKSEVCEVPDMYWIISVVLGVLLLAIMALCVFLVLRLRKEQNHNDKIPEKLGHRNPGYY